MRGDSGMFFVVSEDLWPRFAKHVDPHILQLTKSNLYRNFEALPTLSSLTQFHTDLDSTVESS